MLRVFAPQLPLYGIGIVLTGVLQAHRRFAWPVIAPLLSQRHGDRRLPAVPGTGGRAPRSRRRRAAASCCSAAAPPSGVVALSLSLLIPLRRLGVRPRLGYDFDADARARIGPLVVAGVVTVAAQQIALLVILKRVPIGLGAPIIYNLAQTVYLLPWAVFAVPLAVAAYPTLAAASAVGDEQAYRRTLAPTARAACCCSAASARPCSSGSPDRSPGSSSTRRQPVDPTAAAITAFAPGLLGYGLFALLSRALYARGAVRDAALAITVGWLVVPAAVIGFAAAGAARRAGERASAPPTPSACWCSARCCVAAVYRSAGAGGLAGAGRAAAAGIAAALAGPPPPAPCWPYCRSTPAKPAPWRRACWPERGRVVFLALAYLLDRPDVRPLLAGARPAGWVGDPPGPRRSCRRDTKETVAR